MFSNLSGQSALVVGGSSGIGEAVVRALAAHGARVAAASRSGRCSVAEAEAVELDFTDDPAVARLFAGRGPFDHVVVTAAAFQSGPVASFPLESAFATMDSKFWGSYRIARHARISAGGSLTLVSGVAADRPRAGRALVAAAAAAVEGLARGLAVELVPVRVNCVSPGLVDTPMLRAARARVPDAPPLPQAGLGRVAQAQDVALQILACMANPAMTGAVVRIDGGFVLS